MFKLIDNYILKKFLGTFVFTMLVLTVIAVVIDTSEKADDFVKSGLSARQLVMVYYIGFIPFIMSMIYPLMVLSPSFILVVRWRGDRSLLPFWRVGSVITECFGLIW